MKKNIYLIAIAFSVFISLHVYTQKPKNIFIFSVKLANQYLQLLVGLTTFSILKILQLISSTWESSPPSRPHMEATTAVDKGSGLSISGWHAYSHPRSRWASCAPPPMGSRRRTRSHCVMRSHHRRTSHRGSSRLASTWRAEPITVAAVIARWSRADARRQRGSRTGSAAGTYIGAVPREQAA
jgi:hypothetical protein